MNRSCQEQVHTFVVGDSIKANSLGRALSMALTARELGPVSILAFSDGKTWSGARQFGLDVRPFARSDLADLAEEIRSSSRKMPVVVWFSKGAAPLPRLGRMLRSAPDIRLVADFDDDDVSIMRAFRRESLVNAAKMHPLRRKAPERLMRSQRSLAGDADLLTFSSTALARRYEERWGRRGRMSVIPHTRSSTAVVPVPPGEASSPSRGLRLGFIGTLRRYKGADTLISLLRADPSVELVTFAQSWQPPADVSEQWVTCAPQTALSTIYAGIDALVLPMDDSDPAAHFQLPAKLVDAAVHSTAVVATPTPPIEEFASGAYMPIVDWSRPQEILARIASADRVALGTALRLRYEQFFSPLVTSSALASGLGLAQSDQLTYENHD